MRLALLGVVTAIALSACTNTRSEEQLAPVSDGTTTMASEPPSDTVPATTTTQDTSYEDAYWLRVEAERRLAEQERDALGLGSGDVGCRVVYPESVWVVGPVTTEGLTVVDDGVLQIEVEATSDEVLILRVSDEHGVFEGRVETGGLRGGSEFDVRLVGDHPVSGAFARCWVQS